LFEKTQELSDVKLDAIIYNKSSTIFDRDIDQLQKRITHDEEEKYAFGNYVVRFLPLIVQNHLADSMQHCLPSDGLSNLKSWLD
jgi:hypothetical protein